MKDCGCCGRPEAWDHMYWYAMGRLHGRDPLKELTAADLAPVMDKSYCWSRVTANMDGPYGSEFHYGHTECKETAKARSR